MTTTPQLDCAGCKRSMCQTGPSGADRDGYEGNTK